MSRPAARRLPGIRFEIQAPPVTDALPRMDVAAFVGFAQSGPLHVPVAVEDVADFEAVFGPAPLLAWDAERGEPVHAQLESAVRAFFRNGGRRCWVVRVAGASAKTNTFPVPGLLRCSKGVPVTVTAALARARSEGSWSDGAKVAASLHREPVELVDWSRVGATGAELKVTAPGGVSVGDLLRVSFDSTGYSLLVPVEGVEPVAQEAAPKGPGPVSRRVTARVRAGRVLWQQTDVAPGSAPPFVSWLRGKGDEVSLAVTRMDAPGPNTKPRVLTLTLDLDPKDAPPAGTLLRVVDSPEETHWLLVESVHLGGTVGGAVQVSGVVSRVRGSTPVEVASASAWCERLTLSLWTRRGEEQPAQLERLGFCPAHPRYWAALPTDVERAQHDDQETLPSRLPEERLPQDWRQGVPTERFPLAGPGASDEAFCLPLGLTDQPTAYVGCTPPAGDSLERDGLAVFNADLFLDPGVKSVGLEALQAQADFLRYQSSNPRSLRGIHAVMDRLDATLVAVPDAVHRPWVLAGSLDVEPAWPGKPLPEPPWGTFLACALRPPPKPAPFVAEPEKPSSGQSFTLRWGTVPGTDVVYVLEEATRPDFSDAAELYQGPLTARTLYGRDSGTRYYRVRAERGGTTGPWSVGLDVTVAPQARWHLVPEARYDVGPLLAVQRALMRMGCARGDLLAVLSLPEHYREAAAMGHAATLQSPLGKEEDGVPPLGFAERTALSYGALYHPWTFVSEEARPGPPRRMVPDGTACGVLARRALERGVWVAPANERWTGVVALNPAMSAERWLDLQEAQVNVVRQEPRAFLTLSADTLAMDPDLRPIHVRRLMSLLRRAALRLGATYVFEPNDASFRRRVQRGFEELLGGLFVRGAFAGRTREGAFQVVTGDTLNTPAQAEQGRFFVDLKVAPSQPLTFLNVRLVQSGERGTVTEAR
ncbi:phage tail sheath protein FI [Corallococcus coralloides DSM 2259]|uniref:Phage tail sheath protein FI n=1 Tax=Corallococcus coralloides (strain ATCC 25202 / DSM 2259 / NBRC 100086 / M2) TaxID=1144275 RepID=H8MX71_CORCM|nr:phage tail sheath family protein [Corallococcus coralloides]AFE04879.1 phage tail sheath protein FI [Corallococcus coralloides DSM 2259]